MNFSLPKSIAILERTPLAFEALLQKLPQQLEKVNEGEDTWSAYNIIGHLIHGEKTDWIPRAEIILGDGPDKTFEPYDRFAQERLYSSQPIEALLAEYKTLRKQNIEKLQSWNLTEQDLTKKGIHPELGTTTLQQLIASWTVHDLTHLNQVSRVLVKHFSEDVGPWKKYIKL